MFRKIIFAPLTHFSKDSLQKLSCYKKKKKREKNTYGILVLT